MRRPVPPAPFYFVPVGSKRQRALAKVLRQAAREALLPLSSSRSRSKKRRPARKARPKLPPVLAKGVSRGVSPRAPITNGKLTAHPAEVWVLPMAPPTPPHQTGEIVLRSGEGTHRAVVPVMSDDTSRSVAERVARAINTSVEGDRVNTRKTRLELLQERAQARVKTVAVLQGKAKSADRRSASAWNPPIADPTTPVRLSLTARLLAADPAAQRIARGLTVRGWSEATNARNGEEPDED